MIETGYFRNCFAVKGGFLKPQKPPPYALASLHCWILSTFFQNHCNITDGTLLGVGRREGGGGGGGVGGKLEAG